MRVRAFSFTCSSEMENASIKHVHPHGSVCPLSHSVSQMLSSGVSALQAPYYKIDEGTKERESGRDGGG